MYYERIIKSLIELLRVTWETPFLKSGFLYENGSHWVDHIYKDKSALIEMMKKQGVNKKSVFLKNQIQMEQFIFRGILSQIRLYDFLKWLMDPDIPEEILYSFQFSGSPEEITGITLFKRKDGTYAQKVQYSATIVLKKVPTKVTINGSKFNFLFSVYTAYPGFEIKKQK